MNARAFGLVGALVCVPLFVCAPLLVCAGCGTKAKAVGSGGECDLATDCEDGFICIPQKNGHSICSNDLSQVQTPTEMPDAGSRDASTPDGASDGAPADTSVADTSSSDTGGGDTGGPDTGGPADTGSTQDTGAPPADAAAD
jgi:hypothetical protein